MFPLTTWWEDRMMQSHIIDEKNSTAFAVLFFTLMHYKVLSFRRR